MTSEAGGATETERMRQELERRDEEILRLRELLLAKDVELGEALGRQRELEDIMRGLLTLAAHVQMRVPVLMRLARALVRHGRRILRRLRGRRGRAGG